MKKKGTDLNELTLQELQDKLQEDERSTLTKLRFNHTYDREPDAAARQAQGTGSHPYRAPQARDRQYRQQMSTEDENDRGTEPAQRAP